MPFIRTTRDKKGYETTFVVHAYRGAGGPGRTRVLYLFRSPANLTLGRRPLDDEARVALEHTHPDLPFDWQALGRDAEVVRPQASSRPVREGRPPRPPSAPTERPVVDDATMLARVVGAPEAARLRRRRAELVQRIGRRARSPEERDQLLERVGRLNPDAWGDEPAVRAGVSTLEAEWEAIEAALPARRRGRRGGRRRDGGPSAPSGPTSGIIAEDGEVDDRERDAQTARSDRPAGDPGDDARVGGSGAGDSLPIDDELRQH